MESKALRHCFSCGGKMEHKSLLYIECFDCGHEIHEETHENAWCWKENDKLKKENSWLKAWRKVAHKSWHEFKVLFEEMKIYKQRSLEILDRANLMEKKYTVACKVNNWHSFKTPNCPECLEDEKYALNEQLKRVGEKYIAAREMAISMVPQVYLYAGRILAESVETVDSYIEKRVKENRK